MSDPTPDTLLGHLTDRRGAHPAYSIDVDGTPLDEYLEGVGGNVATDSLFDAKGDLVVATAADTAVRLPVGDDTYVLMADSAEPAGMRWAAPIGAIIDEEVLSVDTASVSFASIPSTYAHLILIFQTRNNLAGVDIAKVDLRLNNDSGSNYNTMSVFGNGTTAQASGTTGQTSALLGYSPAATAGAGYAAAGIIEIPNYKSTTFFTSGFARLTRDTNAATANMVNYNTQFVWRSTAAVTRIDLLSTAAGSPQFMAGSRFTLYGVLGLS